jgi:hypothetical protein
VQAASPDRRMAIAARFQNGRSDHPPAGLSLVSLPAAQFRRESETRGAPISDQAISRPRQYYAEGRLQRSRPAWGASRHVGGRVHCPGRGTGIDSAVELRAAATDDMDPRLLGGWERVSRPMAAGGIGGDPEPFCWDEPQESGAAKHAHQFTTCLFWTAPTPGPRWWRRKVCV